MGVCAYHFTTTPHPFAASRTVKFKAFRFTVRMKYTTMKGVTVNSDDIAFVACRACVRFAKKKGKREREKKRCASGDHW